MARCRHTVLHEKKHSRQDNRLPARTRLDCAPPKRTLGQVRRVALTGQVGKLLGSLPDSLLAEIHHTRTHFRTQSRCIFNPTSVVRQSRAYPSSLEQQLPDAATISRALWWLHRISVVQLAAPPTPNALCACAPPFVVCG